MSALHRSLTAVGFLFALAIFTSLVLVGLSLIRDVSLPSAPVLPAAQAPVAPPAPAAPPEAETPAPAPSPGLWQSLQSRVEKPAAPADGELQKEVEGLRQEIARLGARLDERKPLEGNASGPLLQFFGPRSSLVPEAQSAMRIKNPRVNRDAAGKQVVLTFELHNVDPQQNQQRGYIMAIAKAPDLLLTYPAYALKPGESVLLDFTKGETFAVSRFREAKATFPLAPLEGRKTSYQILLFAHDGKVIGNLHVDGAGK